MENAAPQSNIREFKAPTPAHAPNPATVPALFEQAHSIAEVEEVKNNIAVSVKLNGHRFSVIGYLSPMPGIAPGMNTGDHVLVSVAGDSVLIHGVIAPVDTPARASFRIIEGQLVIEAQGALTLKSGNATVELTEAGGIRIDGKDVRTKAKKTLTMLGGKIELN